MKLSVLICSRDPQALAQVQANLRFSASQELEIIPIDNRHNPYGICEAYNLAASQASGDLLIFMHEDVLMMEMAWDEVLVSKFKQNSDLGVLGLAGTQILYPDPPLWTRAGKPWLAGRIVHDLASQDKYMMTFFGEPGEADREVITVDGLWMAVRRDIWEQTRFNEDDFPAFHFYEHDFCMRARYGGQIWVSQDIMVKHLSGGNFGPAWQSAAQKFREIYGHLLPLSCALDYDGKAVDPLKIPLGGDFFNVDLRGRVPRGTLGLPQ
jgi:hypothetical protein